MLSEVIYNLLALLGQDGILWVVLGMLIGFGIFGWRSGNFSRIAPALMTSTGILGTFCGIFIALKPLDFSKGKVNDSIPMLLEGMTTAFVTSLIGIFAAIVYRSVIAPIADSRRASLEESASPEEREILKRLDAIKQAIAGDGDSSMVNQVRALRDENREGFKKLDGLSEAIRGALVENLQQLMTDIREVIGEQLKRQLEQLVAEIREVIIERLGNTFIDLKDATIALNEWQRQHRAQVEQLTAAFNLAAERIAAIALDCEKIPPTMERLREIVETAHRDVEALNRQVEAFAGMRQQAENAFPRIKEHLDEIGQNLSKSAEGFAGLEGTIRATFENAERESRRLVEQHTQNVEGLAAKMRETLENAQRESADKVEKTISEGLGKFSQGVSQELDKVAEAWGGNLVSIARECAEAIAAVKGDRQ